MTDKQPEALRLAKELDCFRINDETLLATVAELRRLHEENQQLLHQLHDYRNSFIKQRNENDELVEALKQIHDLPEDSRIHYKVARKAIDKATGEQS